MKVLLLEKIKKLGDIGDLITVKDGYARNYLLYRNKALRFTKENQEKFQVEREIIEKANAEKEKIAQNSFKKIDGKIITIIRQAADDGKLYGSVSNKDIAKNLDEKFQVKISVEDIVLINKIKEIGFHNFVVNLHSEVEAKLKIIVARSEEEAKSAIKNEKSEVKVKKDNLNELQDNKSQKGAEDKKDKIEDEKKNKV